MFTTAATSSNVLLTILDGFILFIIVYVIAKFVLTSKRALTLFLASLVAVLLTILSNIIGLTVSSYIFSALSTIYILGIIIVLAPEIRMKLDLSLNDRLSRENSNDYTKKQIVSAVMHLSSKNIGALITIEKLQSLDQYASNAVPLNSEVTKELLISIFTPTTPLHDGAVIIRGNKVRCAAAYFALTSQSDLDKTTGSRHRAGLGISERTDALTIIVSEETGTISISVEGILLKMTDEVKINEYLDMFLK